MGVQERIETKLNTVFDPLHLEVINESGNHNVPPGSESHFKVVIVSDRFVGVSLLKQHQMVNDTLAEELAGPVHALSIQSKTQTQWEKINGKVRDSPPCLGGKANEAP